MVDQGFTSYSLQNDKIFLSKLNQALELSTDLRVPLGLISRDFYRSERAIFKLQGPGQYRDLKDSTKKFKLRHFGFVYPILKQTGDLEASLTGPRNYGSYNVITKTNLTLGTTIPYAIYHQSDKKRSKIPLRKMLFIGPESRFATSDQQGRLKRWVDILDDHINRQLKKFNQG